MCRRRKEIVSVASEALKEFWQSVHKTYSADVRFGLSDEDQRRLLAIEKQLDEARRSRRRRRPDAIGRGQTEIESPDERSNDFPEMKTRLANEVTGQQVKGAS